MKEVALYHETHPGNEQKMRELILLIAGLTETAPSFGSTKLNKVLCYADFNVFAQRRKPLTGMEYQKNEHGPTLRSLLPLLESMEQRGEIHRGHDPITQEDRIVAHREPDLDQFDTREFDTIVRAVNRIKDMTAGEISEISHAFPGWRMAKMFDTIPYEALFWAPRELSEAEFKFGLTLADAG